MTVSDLLLLQERAFSSSPWHSFLGSLDGVGEPLFTWLPEKHNGFPWMNGSIQDIVYHAAGDKTVQVSAAFGGGEVTWDDLRIAKASCPEMVQTARTCHAVVVKALQGCADEGLAERVSTWGGKQMTAEALFLMLIEHDLYHAGQIRYIRNIAG